MNVLKSVNQIYGSKIERIYRILLSRKNKNSTRYRVAKDAGVSYPYVFEVLDRLEKLEILQDYALIDPKKLFYLWASQKETNVYREYNIQDPVEIFRDATVDYAITGYFGENLLTHYLFQRRYEFYIVWEDRVYWHNFLKRRGYSGKGNVKVILTDPHVFYEQSEIDGFNVVSIQQMIVDLLREGAECREAADMLIDRVYYD